MNELAHYARTLLITSTLLCIALCSMLWLELVLLRSEKAMLISVREQYQEQCSLLQQTIENQKINLLSCPHCKKDFAIQEYASDADLGEENDDTNDSEDPFPSLSIINRDPSYLRESALSFARMNDLEPRMKQLYDSFDLPAFESLVRRKRRRQTSSSISRPPRLDRLNELKRNQVQRMLPGNFEWPVKPGAFWLSSPFGRRKKSNGTLGFHYGIDLAAPKGTLVHAAARGVVQEVAYDKNGYGKTIVISHGNDCKTRYAHLQSIAVVVGQIVEKHQCVGRVGDTGSVRGKKDASHLHFELIIGKQKVNPLYALV